MSSDYRFVTSTSAIHQSSIINGAYVLRASICLFHNANYKFQFANYGLMPSLYDYKNNRMKHVRNSVQTSIYQTLDSAKVINIYVAALVEGKKTRGRA